jgi:AcrR family transcriptional regulator
MVALAEELGISRATLYRWTGDRDRLLADILIAELHSLIRAAITRATGKGADRLESAIGWFLDTLAGLTQASAKRGWRGTSRVEGATHAAHSSTNCTSPGVGGPCARYRVSSKPTPRRRSRAAL